MAPCDIEVTVPGGELRAQGQCELVVARLGEHRVELGLEFGSVAVGFGEFEKCVAIAIGGDAGQPRTLRGGSHPFQMAPGVLGREDRHVVEGPRGDHPGSGSLGVIDDPGEIPDAVGSGVGREQQRAGPLGAGLEIHALESSSLGQLPRLIGERDRLVRVP